MVKKKKNKQGFGINLSRYSILNKNLIEELDLLFDLAPPRTLRKSINDIFWAYICNTEPEDLKPEIKEIANDFNCLLRFLEVAEMYEREKEVFKHKKK